MISYNGNGYGIDIYLMHISHTLMAVYKSNLWSEIGCQHVKVPLAAANSPHLRVTLLTLTVYILGNLSTHVFEPQTATGN